MIDTKHEEKSSCMEKFSQAIQQKEKVIYKGGRNTLKLDFSSVTLETIRKSNTRYILGK